MRNKNFQKQISKLGLFNKNNNFESKLVSDNKKYSEIKYEENLLFSNFNNLIKVENRNQKNEIYICFDEKFIKDYDQADSKEQIAFFETAKKGKFCAAKGQNGIKSLAGSNIECNFIVDEEKRVKTKFTHELKINDESRIAFFLLKPLNAGPTILVASHYLKKGFHNKSSVSKAYQTNVFSTSKENIINKVNSASLFATKKTAKEKNSQNQPTLSGMKISN